MTPVTRTTTTALAAALTAALLALTGCGGDPGGPLDDETAVQEIRDRHGSAFEDVTDTQLRDLAGTVCGWFEDDGPGFALETGVGIASRSTGMTGDEARELFVTFTRWRCPEHAPAAEAALDE